jgi:hypothetical protein
MAADSKPLLELVSRLTREHIAPRAAEYDAAGANPIDSWRVRTFRDLRTSTLMPPTVDRMLEGIGKHALGIDGGMFRVAGS